MIDDITTFSNVANQARREDENMRVGAVTGMLEVPKLPYLRLDKCKVIANTVQDGLESTLEPSLSSLIENKPKQNATQETGCFDG